jgi:hypothetical protein
MVTSRDREPSRAWYVVHHGRGFREVVSEGTLELWREFENRRAGTPWRLPPYRIRGRGAWPDWMGFITPLVSDRALSLIGELIADDCEVVPWISGRKHSYSLLNVTSRIPRDQWRCEASSVHGEAIVSADRISLPTGSVPNMFRLEGYDGKLFVSERIMRRSISEGLTGALFVDPLVPEMAMPFVSVRFEAFPTGCVRMGADGRPEFLASLA